MIKTIIITGASSGIGYALAKHLAILGHRVLAIGRNQAALEELRHHQPVNITIVVADINNENDQQKIRAAIPKDETGII